MHQAISIVLTEIDELRRPLLLGACSSSRRGLDAFDIAFTSPSTRNPKARPPYSLKLANAPLAGLGRACAATPMNPAFLTAAKPFCAAWPAAEILGSRTAKWHFHRSCLPWGWTSKRAGARC
jgi:hypothetical protein